MSNFVFVVGIFVIVDCLNPSYLLHNRVMTVYLLFLAMMADVFKVMINRRKK